MGSGHRYSGMGNLRYDDDRRRSRPCGRVKQTGNTALGTKPVLDSTINFILKDIRNNRIRTARDAIVVANNIQLLEEVFPILDDKDVNLGALDRVVLKAAIIRRMRVVDPNHPLASKRIDLTAKQASQLNNSGRAELIDVLHQAN